MITLQAELLCEVVHEAEGLMQEHYLELAKNQARVKLSPDWERYAALEAAGAFLVYTARDDGELVGYAAFFSSAHPHYTGLRLVSNDVLFLNQAHRVGRTGVKLIRYCEQQIAALYGRDFAITWHAKENTALAGMLGRMQYQVQDIVFSRLF